MRRRVALCRGPSVGPRECPLTTKSSLNAFKKHASCNSRSVSPSQRHFPVTHDLPVVGYTPPAPPAIYRALTRHLPLNGGCMSPRLSPHLTPLVARLMHAVQQGSDDPSPAR